jgi:hypothetical protein
VSSGAVRLFAVGTEFSDRQLYCLCGWRIRFGVDFICLSLGLAFGRRRFGVLWECDLCWDVRAFTALVVLDLDLFCLTSWSALGHLRRILLLTLVLRASGAGSRLAVTDFVTSVTVAVEGLHGDVVLLVCLQQRWCLDWISPLRPVLAKVGRGGNATLEDGVLDAAVREIVGSGRGCRECVFSRRFVDVDCV